MAISPGQFLHRGSTIAVDFDSFEVVSAPPQSFSRSDNGSEFRRQSSLIAVERVLLVQLEEDVRATPKADRPSSPSGTSQCVSSHDERLRKSVGGLVGVDARRTRYLRMSSRFVTKSVSNLSTWCLEGSVTSRCNSSRRRTTSHDAV